MAAYAVPSDIAAIWRPLSDAETARATVLLEYAALLLRHDFPTLDARIASEDLDEGLAQLASVQMVKRVLASPEAVNLESKTKTAGPFSETERFRELMDMLEVTDAEARLLRPAATAAVGTIHTKPGLWPGMRS